MSNKVTKNNQVELIGKVVSEFSYSHELFGEDEFITKVAYEVSIAKMEKVTEDIEEEVEE